MSRTDQLLQAGLDAIDDAPAVSPPSVHQSYGLTEGGPPRRQANGLVPQPDGSFIYKRVRLTPTDLEMPADLTEDEWEDIGDKLLSMNGALAWHLGGWRVRGEDFKWGETYARLAAKYGLEVDTLWHYTMVYRAVQNWIRNPVLSFAHHRLVAGMKDKQTKQPLVEQQQYWLEQAAANGWTVKEMREAIQKSKKLPHQGPTIARLERQWKTYQRSLVAELERIESEGVDSGPVLDAIIKWAQERKRKR